MVSAVERIDASAPIRGCWLAWLAVETSDQAALVTGLRLTGVREISWAGGVDLIDEVAHSGDGRFSTVVVTPVINGWTLVIGAWCGLPYLKNVAPVTGLCVALSARFGRAQAFFHSEQSDGEAWLIAENGAVIRRWIDEYPELAMGEPAGVERRLLDAVGISGKPEDLDPDDDRFEEWASSWGECHATVVAAEASLDPTVISQAATLAGTMLVATAPAFEPRDPILPPGWRQSDDSPVAWAMP
jgi:hypothetical protein